MSATEEKHVDPVGHAEATPAPSAAPPAPITSEAFLAKLLASDIADASTAVAPRWIQQQCLSTPSLVHALTPAARLKLYLTMLLGEDAALRPLPGKEPIDTYAAKATGLQKEVAHQLHAQLSSDCTVTEAQWQGFAYALSAETGFYYHAEHVDVMLVMARVVAKSGAFDKSPDGDLKLLQHLFNLLDVVNSDYLVSNTSRLYERATASLLQLLLQYHDPELSVHLDRARVDIGMNTLSWVRRIGVLDGESDAALPLWDWLFTVADPTLVPYVVLAFLMAVRQQALAASDAEGMQRWLETVTFAIPTSKAGVLDPKLADGRAVAPLPVANGKALMQNAELLVRHTPSSAKRVLEFTLCPDAAAINKTPEALADYYAGAVVLPLERVDIAQSFARQPAQEAKPVAGAAPAKPRARAIEYIIADCRSRDSYEYAHMPTSVFLGDAVSYDTSLLSAATTRLESSKGSHVTLFGTGRPIQDEKNLLNVVALHLVQHKFPYISYTLGGFRTVIPLIRANAIEVVMSDEDRKKIEAAAAASRGPQNLASNAAASLTQAFSGITHALEGEAAQQRAAEAKAAASDLANKAKAGLSSAGAWGASMWHLAQEKFSEAREQMSATTAAAAPASSAAATTTATTPKPAAATAAKKPEPKATTTTAKTNQAQAIFTLDEGNGDEDDFGLITSVPAKPMTSAAKASQAEKPAPAAAPTGTAAATATKLSENINAEFDELFGDAK